MFGLVATVAACHNGNREPAPTRGSAAHADGELMASLSMLATGKPLSESFDDSRAGARWLDDVGSGKRSLEQYIDALLATKAFAESIAPQVFIGDGFMRTRFIADMRVVLRSKGSGDDKVYFLREPCKPSDAVKVHPWWDIDHEVRVCADSYRPDVFQYTDGTTTAYCGSLWKATPKCGCGPNLLRCARDREQEKELQRVGLDELAQTTALVVRSNMPIASLFTMNKTVRDGKAEFLYRTLEIPTNQQQDLTPMLRELAGWRTAEPRERHELWPGQHAGILTTPLVLESYLDARQMMREVYSMIWCSTAESRGATAQAVLSLHTAELSGKHAKWEELARRPVCTTCHARLDYGMQFFNGFGDSRLPGRYVIPANVTPGNMKLYGNDIDDPRTEAIATPAGFGKLATAQPEFGNCMSQRVVDHVFGREATGDDGGAVRATYARTPTARQLFKTALLRYADHWKRDREHPYAAAVVAAGDLHKLVEKHCLDCHDEQTPKLTDARLSQSTLLDMSMQVAFHTMPQGANDMSDEDRHALVAAALAQALPDEAERKQAEAYFFSQQRSFPVHDADVAFALIDSLAKVHTDSDAWKLHERDLGIGRLGRVYTPGFAAAAGFKAIRACRKAGLTGDALDACVAKATDPKLLSKSAAPVSPSP